MCYGVAFAAVNLLFVSMLCVVWLDGSLRDDGAANEMIVTSSYIGLEYVGYGA